MSVTTLRALARTLGNSRSFLLGASRLTSNSSTHNKNSGASDEVQKAKTAATTNPAPHTVFGKILRKEIPADIVHEDAKCVAFRDANPVAPTHILVIPRNPIPMLERTEDTEESTQLLGHLLQVAKTLAKSEKLHEGYRIVGKTDRIGSSSACYQGNHHASISGQTHFKIRPDFNYGKAMLAGAGFSPSYRSGFDVNIPHN